ncbi:hypothetical protein [Luteimonas arsenica]|uniref:hypothetical protein n=1 Tax=Luteimonas arsenica TaxID=1586242 RepID=UPI001054D2AC|nr:hypothetical protein [Luteimonas arsenica]
MSARRVSKVAIVLVLVLPWFGYRYVRDWFVQPEVEATVAEESSAAVAEPAAAPATAPHAAAPSLVAEAPRDPQAATGRSEAVAEREVEAIGRDARAGDGEAAVARLQDLGAQMHREVLLADRGSAVRREAARAEVASMGGVRGAGWIDRMTMLVLVSGRGAGHSTVAEACRRLATHGDVAGLAVRVQEVAGDDVSGAVLQGECRAGLSGNAAAVTGMPLPFPGRPLVTRRADGSLGDAAATEEDPEAAAERRRREEESLRILSESTPELPTADVPRVDP